MQPRSPVLAVRCHRFGPPDEVLVVEEEAVGAVGPDQVLVQMRAAPINPADINVIEGKYGFRPALPAHCGNEGAGVVLAVGAEVRDLAPGQRVRPVPGVGCWRGALVTEARNLTPLPATLTDEQAAMISVNPATAFRMLHDFADLRPGDWVIQNCAASAVGRHVIQLARHLGLRTVSVVRRTEAVEALRAIGGDVVITEEADVPREVAAATGGAPVRLALNGVGGESGLELLRALSPGGTLVTYGAMGRQPMALPAGPLIFRELRLAGFWVTAWYGRATREQTAAMFERLAALFAGGTLSAPVEARYSIARVKEAVAHAQRPGRRGKVLLVF